MGSGQGWVGRLSLPAGPAECLVPTAPLRPQVPQGQGLLRFPSTDKQMRLREVRVSPKVTQLVTWVLV